MINAIYILGCVLVTLAIVFDNPTADKGAATMSKKKQSTEVIDPIEAFIRTQLSELLNIDESDIKRDSKIHEDLGADSVDHIEFIMILEEEYDLNVPDDKAELILTVEQAIKLVEKMRMPVTQ